MKIEFYLITVVHCKDGLAGRVANLILDQTCIIEKVVSIGNSLHMFTDSNSEFFEDDKTLLTEILLEIVEVVNHRHFKTNRYTRRYD